MKNPPLVTSICYYSINNALENLLKLVKYIYFSVSANYHSLSIS
jgi:hypothetical protein